MKLPFMELQEDWGEGARGSIHGRKLWISCRRPGMKTETSHLVKSADGRLQGEKDGGFAVTKETSWSVTVGHASANLSTTFLRPRRHHQLHNKQLLCADISPSGGLGVCSSEDGKLWVWEADSGEARRNLEGHFGDVYTCRFFPSGVVVLSGGADCRVKIWSAQDGSCPRTFTGHTRGVTDTAIVGRGHNIISVSSDGTARLWDCSSGKCLDTVASTGCPINACSLVTYSSLSDQRGANSSTTKEHECGTEDKLLLLACEDGSLRGYDVRNRETIVSYSDSKSPLSACAFVSPTLAVCGADDGVITTLDIRNPRSTLNRFQYCESPVRALLPMGGAKCPRRLAVGFRNGSCIVIWSGTTITPTLELTSLTGPETDPISSVCKSPRDIYTSCRDGSVRAYCIADVS